MKTIRITNGTYGYKDPVSGTIKPKSIGETVTVDDKEADRLVDLNVAVIISENNKNVENVAENNGDIGYSVEELSELKNSELAKIAEKLGVDTKYLKKKSDLINAIISAVEVQDNDIPVVSTEDDVVQ